MVDLNELQKRTTRQSVLGGHGLDVVSMHGSDFDALIAELRAARERIADLESPSKVDPDLFQIAVRLAAGHADASDAWALLTEVERLRKRVAELEGGDQ